MLNEKTIVYIGAYSSESGAGIYTFDMNRITGELTPLFDPVKIQNPSYLIIDKSKRFLYCVLETTEYGEGISGGGVAAFYINDDGSLEFINKQPTYGADPCHLSINPENRFLVAANYSGGSFSVFPLDADGSIKPCPHKIAHSGSGPVKDRQSSPHVHFTGFTSDETYLYAVDLGMDQVIFYKMDTEQGSLTPEPDMTISCKPGSGPRHMVLHGNTVYVIHELRSEIGVFSFENDRFVPKQYSSTIPNGYQGANYPAALKLSKDGRLLFASNRGHDSISVFRIREDHSLELLQCTSSGGGGPRDFALDPTEKFMLVANETSNQVNVQTFHRETNLIEPTGFVVSLYRPSCVQFWTPNNRFSNQRLCL